MNDTTILESSDVVKSTFTETKTKLIKTKTNIKSKAKGIKTKSGVLTTGRQDKGKT